MCNQLAWQAGRPLWRLEWYARRKRREEERERKRRSAVLYTMNRRRRGKCHILYGTISPAPVLRASRAAISTTARAPDRPYTAPQMWREYPNRRRLRYAFSGFNILYECVVFKSLSAMW